MNWRTLRPSRSKVTAPLLAVVPSQVHVDVGRTARSERIQGGPDALAVNVDVVPCRGLCRAVRDAGKKHARGENQKKHPLRLKPFHVRTTFSPRGL